MDISITANPTNESKTLIFTNKALVMVRNIETLINTMMNDKLQPMIKRPSKQLRPTKVW
jgi:hypothetical protein